MVPDQLVRLALLIEPVGEAFVQLRAFGLRQRAVGDVPHEHVVKAETGPKAAHEAFLLEGRQASDIGTQLRDGTALEEPSDDGRKVSLQAPVPEGVEAPDADVHHHDKYGTS